MKKIALALAGASVAITGLPTPLPPLPIDRAPGLPPDELGRVSGAFYRAEPSRNRETGGAGLGLSIAKAIVDSHDGTLTVRNREGGGLEATLTLPLR